MVLQAYIDDSMKDGVLVMAGYIADMDSWARFSHEWQSRLTQAGIREFKMSDRLYSSPELNAYFYRVIEEHVHAALCVAVPIEPLRKVVKELKLPQEFADPYSFAIRGIINGCAQHQQEAGISDPIDFIFDDQDNISGKLPPAWLAYLKAIPSEMRNLTGEMPLFRPSHQVFPLQAADIIAYWYRARWNETGSLKLRDDDRLPFPWKSKRNYPRLLIWWSEKDYKVDLLRQRDAFERLFKPNISVTFSFEKWF